jgi:hypothetical protein
MVQGRIACSAVKFEFSQVGFGTMSRLFPKSGSRHKFFL